MAIRELNASGSDAKGTVQLPAARVDGQIAWQAGKITNDRGPALAAEGLQVGTDLFVRELHATGSGKLGTIRLTRAHIQGSSSWQDITLTNDSGPAFHADDLRTGGNLMLLRVDSRTSSDHGAIRMPRARISGQLEIVESTVDNLGGPAWHADGIQIGASLVHRQLHLAVRNSVTAMRLPSATIGGQLVNDDLRIDLPSGIALELEGTQVAASVILPTTVLCPEHDAAEPRCTGTLLVGLDDFTYTTLGQQTWKQWLHLIRHHTPAYRPQPYQQLAAVEHAAGHDNNARETLIAQQEDLRRREPKALGGRLPQVRHQMWGWLGRYGYRAHRLVAALVVVLPLAAGVAYTAGQIPTRPGHHAAERVSPANTTGTPAGAAGTPCSTAELLGLGIDRGLPLGATGLRARCDLDTATRRGQAFTYALWFLQALLWALATLTIAAYTGLIRKPA